MYIYHCLLFLFFISASDAAATSPSPATMASSPTPVMENTIVSQSPTTNISLTISSQPSVIPTTPSIQDNSTSHSVSLSAKSSVVPGTSSSSVSKSGSTKVTATAEPHTSSERSTSASVTSTPVPSLATSSTPVPSPAPSFSPVPSLSTSSALDHSSSVVASSSSHLITPSPSKSQSTPSATSQVVTSPTVKPPTHKDIRIAETNILLVGSLQKDSIFVELTGNANESLDGLFLIVRNAAVNDNKTGIVLSVTLTGNLNDQGFVLLDKSHQLDLNLMGFNSVVVALYSDESNAQLLTSVSLLDSLLLSTDRTKIDPEVAEVYHSKNANNIYVDKKTLDPSQDVSMSMCKGNTSGFVLTVATENKPNNCQLKMFRVLQMKLVVKVEKDKCSTSHLPNHFQDLFTKEIVSKVNEIGYCGLTQFNIGGMRYQSKCVDNSKEIAVRLDVRSALDKQQDCILGGFHNFIKDKGTLRLLEQQYLVANCSDQCFHNAVPASQSGGNNIKVTVAVVTSCICIFLVILLVVIIYMKRNRRGVLQFRMTRLDEDDDDLVGDMDDFVGNQGATFNNYR